MTGEVSKLSVIMACHNRADMTVRAVEQVMLQATQLDISTRVVVFDDGSTDGTRDRIERIRGNITVIAGDGSHFWARGMAVAEREALAHTSPDGFLLWLNDDVDLDANALETALSATKEKQSSVIVGATRDPENHDIVTYSVFRRSGLHPIRFSMMRPGDPDPGDAFNGNFVLVPVSIARQMGGIDGSYAHAFADIDYGLRLRALEHPILLLPSTIGACARNAEPSGPLLARWRRFVGVKGGGHPSSLSRILRVARPSSWWIWFPIGYVQWWRRNLSAAVMKRIDFDSTSTE